MPAPWNGAGGDPFEGDGLVHHSPLDFGRDLGRQLAAYGRLQSVFGVPHPRIRSAGAFQDTITVPVSATATQIVPLTGSPVQQRYRVTLRVNDPSGGVAATARGIRFHVQTQLENDTVFRSVFVGTALGMDGVTTIFAEGRTIGIQALNLATVALQANVSIDVMDNAISGVSSWLDVQYMEGITAATALRFPPFCNSFVILSPTGTPAPTLTGFGQSGATDYDEVVAVPRSTVIPYSPGLAYTLTPVGGAARTHVIHYICEG